MFSVVIPDIKKKNQIDISKLILSVLILKLIIENIAEFP